MKRCITLLVVLCMVLTPLAFANDASDLEAAVMKVKSITEIPEELSEFDYRFSKENGLTLYRLSWNDKNFEIGSLDASVAQSGDLLSFYRNDYTAKKSGETVDINEAIETAVLYGKTILKEDFSKMQLINRDTIPEDSYGDLFVVKFGRFENGIPVKGQECEFGIDKFTGVFETYSGFIFDRETLYKSPENVIGRDKAVSAFLKQLGAELQYRKYNLKQGECTVFPAYFLNDDEFVIDAFSGEKTEIPQFNELYKNGFLANDEMSLGSSALSPQEQAAVDKLGNMLTEKEAADILIKKVDAFDKVPFKNSYLGKNGNGKYVLNLEFSDDKNFYGSGAIGAQSGEILNFYFSDSGAENIAKPLSEEEINKKMDDFVRLIAGEKFNEVKPDETGKSYFYSRYVNGIKLVGDGIRAIYNEKTGQIYSYSLSWTDNAQFPDITNVMSEDEIIDAIADFLGYELYYMGEKLVYDFADKSYSIFSPENAVPLKFDGSEYVIRKFGGYKDIEGHWCEETVNKLLENGIAFEGENFLPEKAVTQRDFVKLVYKDYSLSNDKDIEDFIKRRKLFDNINLDGTISRYEMARAFVVMMGHLELAEKSEIFIKPFNDSVDDGFVGFTAVCKVFGIISGDGNGNYRGKDMATRAEIATMLYRMICRQ